MMVLVEDEMLFWAFYLAMLYTLALLTMICMVAGEHWNQLKKRFKKGVDEILEIDNATEYR